MPLQILDDSDRDALKEQRERLREVEETIVRAQEAGIDVTALRERKNAIERQITQILNAFFPGE